MTKQDNDNNSIVGRGNRDGARLFRDWYKNLSARAQAGDKAAYVFVMGSMSELLGTFDMPTVFPEINSLQTAVRRVAHEYLEEAESFGYSPDICGYVKADVAVQLRKGAHPMGRIPKPAVAVLTNACNTYVKWAEIWERMHDMPVVTIDVPGARDSRDSMAPGDARFEHDRRYVEGQLRELIDTCAEVTGKRFDIDDIAGWITDRFTEDSAGILIDRLFETVKIISRDHSHFDALFRQGVRKQVICTPV